jgi:hypothetical protein
MNGKPSVLPIILITRAEMFMPENTIFEMAKS